MNQLPKIKWWRKGTHPIISSTLGFVGLFQHHVQIVVRVPHRDEMDLISMTHLIKDNFSGIVWILKKRMTEDTSSEKRVKKTFYAIMDDINPSTIYQNRFKQRNRTHISYDDINDIKPNETTIVHKPVNNGSNLATCFLSRLGRVA